MNYIHIITPSIKLKQSSKIIASLLFITTTFSSAANATGLDGSHIFSVNNDSALGGVNGDIYLSTEDGSNSLNSNISNNEIDAISNAHPDHGVDVNDVILGEFILNYSLSNNSNIYEAVLDATQVFDPKVLFTDRGIHDSASTLGLTHQNDLDALESGTHILNNQFTGNANATYFSTKNSLLVDNGDIFTASGIYINDEDIAAALGFDPLLEQIDALVVFDITGDDLFSGLSTGNAFDDLLASDIILFSLKDRVGGFDEIGDNIYFYSAVDGGTGGFYADPGLTQNIDALDVHEIPVPSTITLLLLSGLSFRFFKKKS